MYIISISHTGKITHLDRSTLTPAALSMGLRHNDESSMTKIGINKKNKTKRENTPHIFRKFCAVNKINNIDVNQTIITIGNMSHQYTNWAMYRLFFFLRSSVLVHSISLKKPLEYYIFFMFVFICKQQRTSLYWWFMSQRNWISSNYKSAKHIHRRLLAFYSTQN